MENPPLEVAPGQRKAHTIMWLSIFVVTPVHPQGLHKKFAPTLGLLHPNFCLWEFVGVGPEVWAFVYKYKQFLPLLEFHYNSKNWGLTTLLISFLIEK